VRVDDARLGSGGQPVEAWRFSGAPARAAWVCAKVRGWLLQGVPPQEIAILAPRWDDLGPARLLLEQAGVATQALDRGPVRLVRNYTACLLLDALRKDPDKLLGPSETVEGRVMRFFEAHRRSCEEPTVRALVCIAQDLDRERGLGAAEGMLPITAEEVADEIYQFDAASETHRDDRAVLVTSCHGAKGPEFRKAVLLTDGFEPSRQDVERAGSEAVAWAERRRLFYVAMTRAKEELVLCATGASRLLTEAGVPVRPAAAPNVQLPRRLVYRDLGPEDVYLGHPATRKEQQLITGLREGSPLQLRVNRFGDGWLVCTEKGKEIGDLSRSADEDLRRRGLGAGAFGFAAGEVRVGRVYRHLKFDDITGDKTEDWFVVIPQLRVCR
jgi:ATP-dependent DNA helicase RecQ